MFRRKEATMAPDHQYEANLKKLGFFVNDVGQVRMIGAPAKDFVYYSTNDDRVNEVRREAMWDCMCQETEKRVSALGINRIYLPDFTTVKPKGKAVPILAPSPEILKTRKRVIVIVNDAVQDLGVLAYRHMQRDLGLNGGSVVNFIKEIVKRSATGAEAAKYDNIFKDGFRLEDDNNTPALVVMNTGQLLYSHKYEKAMTMRSWSAMPRKSVSHDMIRIHDVENRIEGHRDPREHVMSVFDNIICDPDRIAPDAEVYVIAIEGGSEYMLNLLERDFKKYAGRVTAMALVHSLVDDLQVKDPNIRAFLCRRACEWRYSDLSISPKDCMELPKGYSSRQDTPSNTQVTHHIDWNERVPKTSVLATITNALHSLVVGTASSKEVEDAPADSSASDSWSNSIAPTCPTFAGGRDSAGECILTDFAVQHAILEFFEQVAQDPSNYSNPNFKPFTAVPQPSLDNPLALDPDNPYVAGLLSLPPEMSPEQAELDMAREQLEQMKFALSVTPTSNPELQEGRTKLAERIARQETKVEKMKVQALATGGLKAEEATELRENWKPQAEGDKVEFAGAQVSSNLLKMAGLMGENEEGTE
ncbi:hypothetical protein HBI88_001180 [Parastagonospora nodorum]|nr:hypothetical protein HBI72_177650 [Parastagonospora nodorum]KAH5328591.1 hypothetical protein HBI11_009260 [Parastagonospora nodorum]KAH5551906.1 hypothetical protein HBI27_001310 [Parastagonospora nodorum]KAH5795581.1 hypothetical protein HBI97_015060 [Parastagonospora nodorum]KAH5797092.1 hypothetical protein HBI96_167650 [Parastagonospora nodorum]